MSEAASAVIPTTELNYENAAGEAWMRLSQVSDGACIGIMNALRRSPTKEGLANLARDTSETSNGWVVEGGDPWAKDQLFVGTVDAAAEAYGADLIKGTDGNWIVTEKDGKPVAYELLTLALPDGRTLQVLGDRAWTEPCASDSAP